MNVRKIYFVAALILAAVLVPVIWVSEWLGVPPGEWILRGLTLVVVGLGVHATLQRIQAAEDQAAAATRSAEAATGTAKAATEQARIAEQGQITDRFTKAVEQLADENKLAVRLGGIYALGRIAHDSKRDHWTVMEVLCAQLRAWRPEADEEATYLLGEMRQEEEVEYWEHLEHLERYEPNDLPPSLPPPADIQAILDVLRDRKRDRETDDQRLDLRRVFLRKANLVSAYLQRADLRRAVLDKANLSGGDLSGANLRMANLTGADLTGANLTGANLDTIMISQEQIDSAIGDKGTVLRKRKKRPAHWITSGGDSDQG